MNVTFTKETLKKREVERVLLASGDVEDTAATSRMVHWLDEMTMHLKQNWVAEN